MANDHNETMKVATDAGVALVKTIKRNAELEAEIARLKEEHFKFAKWAAKELATLTADNERLSARVERLTARVDELEKDRDRLRLALRMSDADRRQWYLSELIALQGYFSRKDLCQEFKISVPQASTDIKRFLSEFPFVATYDRSAKRYVRRELEEGK